MSLIFLHHKPSSSKHLFKEESKKVVPKKCFIFVFCWNSFSSFAYNYMICLIHFLKLPLFLNAFEDIIKRKNFTTIINSFYLQWSLGIYFFYTFPICYNLRRQRNIRKLCTTLPSDVRKSSLIWLLLIPGSFLLVSIKLVSVCFVCYSMVHVQSISITKHRRLQGSSIHRK